MATNYPSALDDGTSLPNPSGSNTLNNPDHGSMHSNANDAVKALEGKLGTGATTPTANTLLLGTGTGTSAWSQVTSAQLAASISDETGSGSNVFATTPTLVTPKVDTINEATGGNGTTVGGVNIRSGALNTNNSVPTAAIAANAVTTAKLATGSNFTPVTVMQNPYKFSVYRSAAFTAGSGLALVQFDTKTFDTSSNVDVVTNKGRFTAPLTGFYYFSASASVTNATAGGGHQAALYKNGSIIKQGEIILASGAYSASVVVSGLLSLAANDYVEIFHDGNGKTGDIGATKTYFDGFLVSAT